ncbi:unnamed protein product [Cuscuta campestris]|uniref:Protein JASON n=1 Tax=Cuscuta campestris TaxID=132261 RepID=A0A484MDT2_9ASTE|nr:unnamed protein product [Cuscuta campestris]
MGNFLGCFGGKDDSRKRRKQRNDVVPRDQRHGFQGIPQSAISREKSFFTEPPPANLVLQNTTEEKVNLSTRKRVTFDENITTYEHISVKESTESLPEKPVEAENEKQEEKPNRSSSSTEGGYAIPSAETYPSNYRYQNCRDSDEEEEEEDDDDDEEFHDSCEEDEYSDGEDRALAHEICSEPVDSYSGQKQSLVDHGVDDRKGYIRDRSVYVHPVLNPVENISQWKALKSKAAQPVMMPQKENLPANKQDLPRVSFSSEPKSSTHKNQQEEEIAVNASLSSWLTPPSTPPAEKSAKNVFEDRPILGALTVEELKQQISSSPRRSPSPSPVDVPIIGTVGTYWNCSGGSFKDDDNGSVSSFKGIPNTTSKYREDKRVNWHSTPFQTRLERALNRGAAEA